MNPEDMRKIAYEKIGKALSKELDAPITAQYILAFAMLEQSGTQVTATESIKV